MSKFVTDWSVFTYDGRQLFKPYEFDSPDAPGSGEFMVAKFIEKLFKARIAADIPFIFNSAFRTEEHNKKVGGKPNSSHLGGLAVDIACTNSRHRAKIIIALIDVGFTRIGIGETFIHVDFDETKPQEVFWLY